MSRPHPLSVLIRTLDPLHAEVTVFATLLDVADDSFDNLSMYGLDSASLPHSIPVFADYGGETDDPYPGEIFAAGLGDGEAPGPVESRSTGQVLDALSTVIPADAAVEQAPSPTADLPASARLKSGACWCLESWTAVVRIRTLPRRHRRALDAQCCECEDAPYQPDEGDAVSLLRALPKVSWVRHVHSTALH